MYHICMCVYHISNMSNMYTIKEIHMTIYMYIYIYSHTHLFYDIYIYIYIHIYIYIL